jgi:hypothetical protein
MKFKYLDLKKTGEVVFGSHSVISLPESRRKFLKTLGIGSLTWNPFVSTLSFAAKKPFTAGYSKKMFAVYRNGKKVWSVDSKTFGSGLAVSVKETSGSVRVKARNLRILNTGVKFGMNAVFREEALGWTVNISIPEFDLNSTLSLSEWLDGNEKIRSKVYLKNKLLCTGGYDGISLDGIFDLKIDNKWNIEIKKRNGINAVLNGNKYPADALVISPCGKGAKQIGLKASRTADFKLNGKDLPKKLIGNIFIDENNKLNISGNDDGILLITGLTGRGGKINTILVSSEKGELTLDTPAFGNGGMTFGKYVYVSEYSGNGSSRFALFAKMSEEGNWISNDLGAFRFGSTDDEPDFALYGNGNTAEEIKLEPALKAFKPDIKDALTLPVVMSDTIKTRVKTVKALPVTTGRRSKNAGFKTINEAESDTIRHLPVNDLHILDFGDNIHRFRPRRALKIRMVRPEDLLWLDFEFFNFQFINKQQGHFVTLSDPKRSGIMVVYFPSQHTIEEAFYETNSKLHDSASTEQVKLPVRHLRAKKSRLVFELPAGHDGFPLTMPELLDWSKFRIKVNPRSLFFYFNIESFKKLRLTYPGFLNKRKSTGYVKLKYLDSEDKGYAIKLAETNKNALHSVELYNKDHISKMLEPEGAKPLEPSLQINNIRRMMPDPGPVGRLETCIEAPALLYISPDQNSGFIHRINPVFRNVSGQGARSGMEVSMRRRVYEPINPVEGKITELWHTVLGVKLKNNQVTTGLPMLKTIRALWAFDALTDYTRIDKAKRLYPFRSSLDANNRHKLVHLTSNYNITGYKPAPVNVNNLMLTSLGAYIDWHGFFNSSGDAFPILNIIEWQHIAALGRDHYVKVVEEGNLFPFGHRAAVVTITERKFDRATRSAVNRQRKYVIVLQKEVFYDRDLPDGRFIEFPFQVVRVETVTTPDVDKPESSTLAATVSGLNFLINVGGKGFRFDITFTDKEGEKQHIRMPLAFIESSTARSSSDMEKIINEYHKSIYDEYTRIDVNGQEIAYAPSFVDGDTAFETERIQFGAIKYPGAVKTIKYHPVMRLSEVYIKQVDEMTGSRKPVEITLTDDDNKGMVFAEVKNGIVDFSGSSDKSGGFLSPNMSISSLSKLQGPAGGDVNKMKDLVFDPKDFFEALQDFPAAKIFGVIKIFDLLLGGLDLGNVFDDLKNAVKDIRNEIESIKSDIAFVENKVKQGVSGAAEEMSGLKSQLAAKVNDLLSVLNGNIPKIPNFKAYITDKAFCAEYKWQPEFSGNKIDVIPDILRVNVQDPKKALTITTKFEKPFDSSKPAALNGNARFENFGIDIVPILAINFNYLEFRTGSSSKTDVKADIDADNPIEFKGVLAFVNNLQSIIPPTGFSGDGPYIELKPTGVKAGFNISIPNVEVGVCMISNISLGAFVLLPFTGAPLQIGFNFCRRENPFLLTISCFGGGGYFLLITTLHGIQSIEAAFEFGAAMSLNVGVASGGVSAMGGIYYKMELVQQTSGEMEQQTTLKGYLRINGHLSILGIITLSLEFYLEFNAVIENDKVKKLEGMARVKVKIEILFFSKTVTVTVRRQLKGGDADPSFAEMIDMDDWQEYCLAFAS